MKLMRVLRAKEVKKARRVPFKSLTGTENPVQLAILFFYIIWLEFYGVMYLRAWPIFLGRLFAKLFSAKLTA